jgi:hypothetical protein
VVIYAFDEQIDAGIEKSVKATLRFYNELRKAAIQRGETQTPPSLDAFTSMAKGLMEANKQVAMGRLRAPGMRDMLERAWSQKLLLFSTQKLLRDSYDALLRRF